MSCAMWSEYGTHADMIGEGTATCCDGGAVREGRDKEGRFIYVLADPDSWFSDKALRKQELLRDWPSTSPPPLTLLLGMYEPRTQPEPHERCKNCSGDGRDGAGGGERHGVRWCSFCLGRGRDEDYAADLACAPQELRLIRVEP